MNIAICDDNNEHINTLENYLSELKQSYLDCDAYLSGEELVSAYKRREAGYDVIFLDMEMEPINGIQTAKSIREFDEHVIIVFITSHTEYMLESFECAPFRFLLKPVSFVKFQDVYYKICQKISKERKTFSFSENKTKIRLFCDDIIYFETQDHWIWIHTKETKYKLCKSMTDLYEHLDPKMFFRTHRSFIINLGYIKQIQENEIVLYHCNNLIPISRSYKKAVIARYTDFVEKEYNV